MEIKYSKKPFDGYTHRFKVVLEKGDPYSTNIDIYSDSESYQDIINYINNNKTEKLLSFAVIHRASKEEDEMSSKLIDEFLKDI